MAEREPWGIFALLKWLAEQVLIALLPDPEVPVEEVEIAPEDIPETVDTLVDGLIFVFQAWEIAWIYIKKKFRARLTAWLSVGKRGLKLFGLVVVSAVVIMGLSYIRIRAITGSQGRARYRAFQTLDDIAKIRMMIAVAQGINKVVRVLSPEWKKLTTALANAWGAVGDAVGIPMGVMFGIFSSYKSFLYSGYALVGVKPGRAEEDFWSHITGVVEELDTNFWKYVRNPGGIMQYIDDNFLVPIADDVSAGSLAALESINANLVEINKVRDDLEDVGESFVTLLEALPDGMKEAIETEVGPWIEGMQTAWQTLSDIVDPLMETIIPTLEDLIRDTRITLAEQAAAEAEKLAEARRLLGLQQLTIPDRTWAFNEIIGLQGMSATAAGAVIDDLRATVLSLPHVEPYAEQEPYSEELPGPALPARIPPEEIAHPWMVTVDESAPYGPDRVVG